MKDKILLFLTNLKSDLTDNLTLRYFRAGVNKDGYWNIHIPRSSLRSIVYILFPILDYLFLFDQSSVHTKVKEDGLLVDTVNVNYRGAVAAMHVKTVVELGTYTPILKVGEQ